ncbi:hypothetical protein [Azospirillum canadense]|uniref:hypothetical protein n=1 Tax=Azospirillum canadense TaxID=403962 RepID=UPI002227D613|nr:hypothetical protein [Azospirillum canadense]MCW2240659.1 hypothetical protein [Azospirillum canadense]
MATSNPIVFAGKVLERVEDHLHETGPSQHAARRLSYRLTGAFLARPPEGGAWLFVAGAEPSAPTVRLALLDDSPGQDNNATTLAALGVPILSAPEAEANYAQAGLRVWCLTATERAIAALREEFVSEELRQSAPLHQKA